MNDRRVIVRPSEVEFRFHTSRGSRVVRVFLFGEPRIVAFSVSGTNVAPMGILLSELVDLVEEAKSLAGMTPVKNEEVDDEDGKSKGQE